MLNERFLGMANKDYFILEEEYPIIKNKDKQRKIRPLFIWAGGKNKMLKHYIPLMANLEFENYCEPFFGGGAMLLRVLVKNPNLKRIVINDINDGIIRIYNSIKNDVNTFIHEMDRLEGEYIRLNKEERKKLYFEIRYEHAFDYEKWRETPSIEAAHLYFLMKTGFNGIWQVNQNTNGRFGTPSGLLNQVVNIYDKNNVMMWSEILQENVEIYSEDWRDCVNRVEDNNTFFFLDPPYRGGFTKYGQDFDDDKQIEVVAFCKRLKNSKVFLCNRDEDDGFFEKYKGSLNLKRFEVIYTAGRRKKTERKENEYVKLDKSDGYDESPSYDAKLAKEILLYN